MSVMQRFALSLFTVALVTTGALYGQPITDPQGDVIIGGVAPDSSAILELRSTTKGLLLPRMTTAQMNAIDGPANGLCIFNTDDSTLRYNFGDWQYPEWYTLVATDTSGNILANLLPGHIWYGDSDSTAVSLAPGILGQVLTIDTTGGFARPIWSSSLGPLTSLYVDSLTVGEHADIQGPIENTTGQLVFDDSANFTGSVDIDENLNVDRVSSLNDTVNINGPLNVTDSAYFAGNVQIDGKLYVDSLCVTGPADFGDNVTFTGDSVIFSDTTVVSLSGGDVIFNSDSTIVNNTFVSNDTAVFNANVYFNGDSVVYGDTTVVNMGGGDLIVNGDSIIINDIFVSNDTAIFNGPIITTAPAEFDTLTVNDLLTVDGVSNFNDTVNINGPLNVTDSAYFAGNVQIDGKLYVDSLCVTGPADFGDNVTFTGDSVIFSDTTVVSLSGGDVIFNSDSTIVNNTFVSNDTAVFNANVYFNGDSVVYGDTTVVNMGGGDLIVNGDSVIINDMFVSNDTAIFNGPIITTAPAEFDTLTVNDLLTVDGVSNFNDTVNINGPLNVTDSAYFAGNVQIDGKLYVDSLCVTGPADFGDNVTFTGDSVLFSDTTLVNIGDNIVVNGDTTLFNEGPVIFSDTTVVNMGGDDFIVNGDSVIINDMFVSNDTAIFNGPIITTAPAEFDTLTVNDLLTVDGVSVFNDTATFNEIANFNDSAYFAGNVQIDGKLYVDSLCVTGPADFGDNVTFTGDSVIFSDTTVVSLSGGDVIFNSDSTVVSNTFVSNNNAYFNGDSVVYGDTTVVNMGGDDFIVNGDSVIINDMFVSNDTAVFNGPTIFSGPSAFDTLTVNDLLTVDGIANFNDTININGPLNVTDSAYFAGNVQIDGKLYVDSLCVTGSADFGDNVTFTGDSVLFSDTTVVNIGDNIVVNGDTTLFNAGPVIFSDTTVVNMGGDDFIVNGDSVIINDMFVSNDTAVFNGPTIFSGPSAFDTLTVNDLLTVDGIANFNDTVNINGPLNVTDSAYFAGNVQIDGKLYVDSLCVTGPADFGGIATFDSTAIFNDSLLVNGPASFDSTVAFTGLSETTSGDSILVIDGNGNANWISKDSLLASVGNSAFDTLTVNDLLTVDGVSVFNDTATFNEIANFNDSAYFAGNVQIDGKLYVDSLCVTGPADFGDNVTFTGDSVLFSDTTVVNIGDNIVVNGDTTLFNQGSVVFSDTTSVNFGGPTTFDTTSVFNDSAVFNGPVVFNEVPDILEWIDGDSISASGTIYAKQALENGSADTVVVTDAGRVGIGTSSPVEALEVHGDILFGGPVSTQEWHLSSTTAQFLLKNGPNYNGGETKLRAQNIGGTGADFKLAIDDASSQLHPNYSFISDGNTGMRNVKNFPDNLAFSTGGSDRMLIDENGNVGIGLGNGGVNPTNRLHVRGITDPLRLEGLVNDNTLESVMVVDGQGVAHSADFDSLLATASGDLAEWVDGDSISASGTIYARQALENGPADTVVVTDGGRMGLGLSAPSAQLHLSQAGGATAQDQLILEAWGNSGVGRGNSILFRSPTAGVFGSIEGARITAVQTGNGGARGTNLAFETGLITDGGTLTERMRVSKDGDVGIGETNPQNRLHVNATSDPLRLEGLVEDNTLDSLLVVDGQGVVHWISKDSLLASVSGSSFDTLTVNDLLTVDGVSVFNDSMLVNGPANFSDTTIFDGPAFFNDSVAFSNPVSFVGVADAVVGNTLAGNPGIWELEVIGDVVATGLVKAGGSLWMDGRTAGNHQVVGNDTLRVGTLTDDDLYLVSDSTIALTVHGSTQNIGIGSQQDDAQLRVGDGNREITINGSSFAAGVLNTIRADSLGDFADPTMANVVSLSNVETTPTANHFGVIQEARNWLQRGSGNQSFLAQDASFYTDSGSIAEAAFSQQRLDFQSYGTSSYTDIDNLETRIYFNSGSVGTARGVDVVLRSENTGIINRGYGIEMTLDVDTVAVGLMINDVSSNDSIATGIYIEDINGPERWSIRSVSDAPSQHRGNMQIGGTLADTATTALHVISIADPLRLEGLQNDNTLDSVLVVDGQGVAHWISSDSLVANASAIWWDTTGGSGNSLVSVVPSAGNSVAGTTTFAVVAGSGNTVNSGAHFSTISGGVSSSTTGLASTIGGGLGNSVNGIQSTVAGGNANQITGGNSTIGGGISNTINALEAVIVGGQQNQVSGRYGAIGGGRSNNVSGDNATISGGATNISSGNGAAVGGGTSNVASGSGATVAGGVSNTSSSFQTSVGGGINNTASNQYATISGGNNNSATGSSAAIGGGVTNTASGSNSVVGGGANNLASGSLSTVGGGQSDTASGIYSTVSGGFRNLASAGSATVGGGDTNQATGLSSTVGGGAGNTSSGSISVVAGGFRNVASGDYSTVGGGQSDTASGLSSTVSGGFSNTASGSYSTVSGGQSNLAIANHTTINGGLSNTIESSAHFSLISGGARNTIRPNAEASVIAGGNTHVVDTGAVWATVGGGISNRIGVSARYAVISGGQSNTIESSVISGSIGGGTSNTIGTGANYSTIVGGRGMRLDGARSLGFLANNPTGSMDMAISASDVVAFGNSDVWLANNDNDASQLRFYEANSTTGAFPGATNYSSFEARAQTADINYQLPDSAGIAGDVLAVTAVSGTDVTLDWQSSGQTLRNNAFQYTITGADQTAGFAIVTPPASTGYSATAIVMLTLESGTSQTYTVSAKTATTFRVNLGAATANDVINVLIIP